MSDSRKKPHLKITDATPADVPSFACVVYVSRDDQGRVKARVANLAGIEFSGSSERDVLSKLVPAFKSTVAAAIADDSPVPWIDPPLPMRPDEQKRFVPVHL